MFGIKKSNGIWRVDKVLKKGGQISQETLRKSHKSFIPPSHRYLRAAFNTLI